MKRIFLALSLLIMSLSGCTADSYRETGIASWYGSESGTHTANGERFNPHGYTAASWYLPFNSKVRVTNLKNGRSVIVRVNDRGPHKRLHRLIDLSQAAAKMIRLGGLSRVEVVAFN